MKMTHIKNSANNFIYALETSSLNRRLQSVVRKDANIVSKQNYMLFSKGCLAHEDNADLALSI